MILYLDASALVKRYVAEAGSQEVNGWIAEAQSTTTAIVTRAEVAAAITRASRLRLIAESEAQNALELFRSEWESLVRLPVSEVTVRRADRLACQHGLRGYDAIHLAVALLWQEALGLSIVLATYDRPLWQAGKTEGLGLLPEAEK